MTIMEMKTVTAANNSGLSKRLAGIQRRFGTVKMIKAIKIVLTNKDEQRIIVSWVLICTHHDLEVSK